MELGPSAGDPQILLEGLQPMVPALLWDRSSKAASRLGGVEHPAPCLWYLPYKIVQMWVVFFY